MKRLALGKGLEALIPGAAAPEEKDVTEYSGPSVIHEIPVARVKTSPFQPRLNFDSVKLAELAESIKQRGVIQPIVVRVTGEGYELIVGERRLRAVALIGRPTIPAIVINSVSNEDAMELTLIENIQRQDLNPIEEASAFRRLMAECNLGQAEVASKVGKDRSSIANSIRLLSLPEKIQQMIADGLLSSGHARALLALATDSDKIAFAEKVISEQMSVRDLEKQVYADKPRRRAQRGRLRSAQVVAIEDALKRKLGTKVFISQRKKGGRIMIEYYSNDELDRLLSIFGVTESL